MSRVMFKNDIHFYSIFLISALLFKVYGKIKSSINLLKDYENLYSEKKFFTLN